MQPGDEITLSTLIFRIEKLSEDQTLATCSGSDSAGKPLAFDIPVALLNRYDPRSHWFAGAPVVYEH